MSYDAKDVKMGIKLISADDKPIKRRVFMGDYKYTGSERRKSARPYKDSVFNCIKDVTLLVCAAGVFALMFTYVG